MTSQYCHDPVVLYDVRSGIGAEPPEKKPRSRWQFWKK
jgi:hypothetical protein